MQLAIVGRPPAGPPGGPPAAARAPAPRPVQGMVQGAGREGGRRAGARLPEGRVLEGELLRNRRRQPRPEGAWGPQVRRALGAYRAVQEGPPAPPRVDLRA